MTQSRMNVILIHVDTLRPDHLSCYGYRRPTSPNIDKMAMEGTIFTRAYSTDVPTVPYYTSMFTGLRGTATGVVWTEDLPREIPLFTRHLAAKGIITAAVSTMSSWKPWLTQDFHIFMNPIAGNRSRLQQVDGEEINEFAISFLQHYHRRRFFLWLHYWDVHVKYDPPGRYADLFDENDGVPPNYHDVDWTRSQYLLRGIKERMKKGPSMAERLSDWKRLVALYDGEIAYVDDCIGALMNSLREYGIDDETMVIISADHGESHGEHDDFFNHVDVYEPTVHVPLVIKHPELPSGRKIGDLVQNIDLVPTILEAFEIEKPGHLEGISLLPRLCGESDDPIRREVFCDTGLAQCARMISDGEWKLIETIHRGLWEKHGNPELYNLNTDPLETDDLSLIKKDKADELQLKLHRNVLKRLGKRCDPLRLVAERDPHQMTVWMRRLGLTHQDLKEIRRKRIQQK